MRIVEIGDAGDPRLADNRDLTDVALRRVLEPDGGLYIAESAKVIGRALAAGHRPRSILVQPKWVPDVTALLAGTGDDTPVYVVPAEVALGWATAVAFTQTRDRSWAVRTGAALAVSTFYLGALVLAHFVVDVADWRITT
jgi:hypothetical protein